MKHRVGIIIAGTAAALWSIRYAYLNHGFTAHWEYPRIDRAMNETVREYGEPGFRSYNMVEQPGVTISVNEAHLYDSAKYLRAHEIDPAALPSVSDKYLELTAVFTNNGSGAGSVDFLGLQLLGRDWFAQVNQRMTALVNPQLGGSADDAAIGRLYKLQVQRGTAETVRVVYSLNASYFRDDTWQQLAQEDMWLIVTMCPEQHRVVLHLSDE